MLKVKRNSAASDRAINVTQTERPTEVPTIQPNLLLNVSQIPSSHIITNLIDVPQSTVKIYSAFLDDREYFYGPAVYVLGIASQKHWTDPLNAIITYTNKVSVCLGPSEVEEPCDVKCNRYIHHTTHSVINHVFRLQHSLNTSIYPANITLSKRCLGPHSAPLKIHPRNPNKEKIGYGVCVQTPVYGRVAQNLVYFIEMNRLLGAQWIMLYSMVNGLERNELLLPYVEKNILRIAPWPKLFKRYNPAHYYGEILSIHDCLYRSLSWIEYLVFIDQDELIIPRNTFTWREMIKSLPRSDGYMFLNTYYLAKTAPADHKLPKARKATNKLLKGNTNTNTANTESCRDVHYFSKLYRSGCNFVPHRRSKVIIRVSSIKNLDIHAIPRCNKANVHVVSNSVSTLFHYRNQVSIDCLNKTMIYDPVVSKYFDQFKELSGVNVCKMTNE